MTAQPIPTMAAAESSAPATSGRPPGPRNSGTQARAKTRHSTAIGMFSANTACHGNRASSAPPSSGPSACPPAATAVQIPIARGRSRSENTRVSTASVAGTTHAPPTPMPALATISCTGSPAVTASTENPAKSASPASHIAR